MTPGSRARRLGDAATDAPVGLSSAMASKRSHLGMAGQFAAMSEFLLRGYNVAVPAVDTGDDIFVVDDRDGLLFLVQVKTGTSSAVQVWTSGRGAPARETIQYNLSRKQLAVERQRELYFMLMYPTCQPILVWRWVLISRSELRRIRTRYVSGNQPGQPGPRPRGDHEVSSDQLLLSLSWSGEDAQGWGVSLALDEPVARGASAHHGWAWGGSTGTRASLSGSRTSIGPTPRVRRRSSGRPVNRSASMSRSCGEIRERSS